MTLTVILVCVVLVLVTVLAFVIEYAKKVKRDNKELKNEVERQKENIAYLVRHAEELMQIQTDKDKTSEEIRNAKTDEEIADIVNAIIQSNNDRVRNDRQN